MCVRGANGGMPLFEFGPSITRFYLTTAQAAARDPNPTSGSVREQFVSIPGAAIKGRDRSGVSSASLRKPEMPPPQEILELGCAQFKDVIQSAISALIADRNRTQQGAYLVPGEGESTESSGAWNTRFAISSRASMN